MNRAILEGPRDAKRKHASDDQKNAPAADWIREFDAT